MDFGRPVILNGKDLEPVFRSGSWDLGVAISPDGSTVAFDVVSGDNGESLGWQSVYRTGNDWRPNSLVYDHPTNYAQLVGIGEDDRTAWGVKEADSSSESDYQLVSLDLETGSWIEWFGNRDLEVAPQDFLLEVPVFR